MLARHAVPAKSLRADRGRGQAMVEFALVLSVAMIVLFVAVQLAIIGEAALSLGEMNYQGARWAAVNTCATPNQVASYMMFVGSPTVTTPSSCGSALTITITDSNGSGQSAKPGSSDCTATSAPTVTTPCTTSPVPRSFGTSVTVNLTYTIPPSQLPLLLGKTCTSTTNFLGIYFPCTLKSSETAMSE
jgi:hypothetical protein